MCIRGLKPVYWCLHDQTALAEAEVEYEDHISPSIWVRYRVLESANRPATARRTAFMLWCGRPRHGRFRRAWPCLSILNIKYVFATDEQGDTYSLAQELLEGVAKETGLRFGSMSRPFPGRRFRGRQIPASVSRSRGSGRTGRARDPGARQRNRAHRARPRRRGFRRRVRSMAWKLTRRSTITAASPRACRNTTARPYSRPIRRSSNC